MMVRPLVSDLHHCFAVSESERVQIDLGGHRSRLLHPGTWTVHIPKVSTVCTDCLVF